MIALWRTLPDFITIRSIIARRGGHPIVAVFAHLDTTGWTLGYKKQLISIGGPDGTALDRGGIPMDWVFVGAPEHDPPTARERVYVSDLHGMAEVLVHLVNMLSERE